MQNVEVTTVEKIFKNLDVDETSGIDQIPSKFLEDGAAVIAIHLANIINPSTRHDVFPSKCKIAKHKSFVQREN